MGGESGMERRNLGLGPGKVHEQEGFEGIRMTASEFKSRRPTGSGAGKVNPLQAQRIEKGRQEVGGRLRLATFVGDGVAKLAEKGQVG